jgi:hypothetical protein
MFYKQKTEIKDSNEISIVVQGPMSCHAETQTLIDRLRKTFPRSQIIVSTWKNRKKLKLNGVDDLIQDKMPKQILLKAVSGAKNVERQIVSTLNGLRKAKKKYCLKIRTDMILLRKPVLYIEKNNTKHLRGKILIPTEYTRDENLAANYRFHFSDILQFGFTSDLYKIWKAAKKINIPKIAKNKKIVGTCYSEQFIYLAFFRPQIIKSFQWSKIAKLSGSEKALVDNFILYPLKVIGFRADRLCTSFRNTFSCYSSLSFLLARQCYSSNRIVATSFRVALWIFRKTLKRMDDVFMPTIHGVR